MSIQILYQADICIDGIAASTEFSRIKLTLNQPAKERTAFQDVARCYLPGIYSATADGEFYYQTGAAFVENRLELATIGPLSLATTAGLPGNMVLTIGADLVVGNIVNIFKGISAKVEPGAQHGEVLKATLNTEAAERAVQATRLLRAANAVTGTSGLGTPFNLGNVPAGQQMWAALHVLATTGGAPAVTFGVAQSSSSAFTVSTNIINFIIGTTAVGAEWGQSGAVSSSGSGPWYAAKWQGFTGTAATISMSAGIQ